MHHEEGDHMNWVMETVSQYGYAAIYILLAVGIVGLPIPDEILMTTVGYLASIQTLDYMPSIAISFLGAMTGMMLSYWLGRTFGHPLLIRYGKYVFLTPDKLDKVAHWFKRYGGWTILIGYFIPGLRHLTCYFSGISGMRFRNYFFIASLGALLWCSIFITMGHALGRMT